MDGWWQIQEAGSRRAEGRPTLDFVESGAHRFRAECPWNTGTYDQKPFSSGGPAGASRPTIWCAMALLTSHQWKPEGQALSTVVTLARRFCGRVRTSRV